MKWKFGLSRSVMPIAVSTQTSARSRIAGVSRAGSGKGSGESELRAVAARG